MGEKGTAWGVLGAGQGKRIVEGGAVWERITKVSMNINNWVSSYSEKHSPGKFTEVT